MWPWSEIVFFVLIQAVAGGTFMLFVPAMRGLPAGAKRPYLLVLFVLLGIAFPFLPQGLFTVPEVWFAAGMLLLMLLLFGMAYALIKADPADPSAGRSLAWPAAFLAVGLLGLVATGLPVGHAVNLSAARLSMDLFVSACMIGSVFLLFIPFPAHDEPRLNRTAAAVAVVMSLARLAASSLHGLSAREAIIVAAPDAFPLIGIRLGMGLAALILAGSLWYSSRAAGGRVGGANGAPKGSPAPGIPPMSTRAALLAVGVIAGQLAAAILLLQFGLIL